jgi:hypothetical protein
MEDWLLFSALLVAFIMWAIGLKCEVTIYDQSRGWFPDE